MKKAETQQAILTAAKKLFITNGYKGTTTVQIAKEAGVSEMTLFRHFSTKDEIFLAVIHPLVSYLDSLDVNEQSDVRKTVRDLMENQLRFLLEERDLVRLVVMESFLAERNENPIAGVMARIEKVFSVYPLRQRELLVRLITGYILSGIFVPKKTNYKEDLEMFLQNAIDPLLERFEKERGDGGAENS
ncbi:TetR/AcrR family transcriptional regulator [Dethiobacter alkaliphilus]|uniref:Transcriptional regulator, TetR family n=1 Tax=Dethiobacter alkaliphilus AHT 1 TaxID=555088 RepID=C0GC85_DETAL|nr:TetR/AcrR family transcriptional regulator [Dethiobacter alkaliphilus]EEG78820.1 transcriptional regulator, TetR family [Dethiobacter alkaliphilus AHT 1]